MDGPDFDPADRRPSASGSSGSGSFGNVSATLLGTTVAVKEIGKCVPPHDARPFVILTPANAFFDLLATKRPQPAQQGSKSASPGLPATAGRAASRDRAPFSSHSSCWPSRARIGRRPCPDIPARAPRLKKTIITPSVRGGWVEAGCLRRATCSTSAGSRAPTSCRCSARSRRRACCTCLLEYRGLISASSKSGAQSGPCARPGGRGARVPAPAAATCTATSRRATCSSRAVGAYGAKLGRLRERARAPSARARGMLAASLSRARDRPDAPADRGRAPKASRSADQSRPASSG